MVQLALAFVAAALVSVQASPIFEKRIQQTIANSTLIWEAHCDAATSNNPQCNVLAVAAFQTLLAAADTCAQQDAADNLIDFSKQQQNNRQMIIDAQIFVQQARNSPNKLFTPYCNKPPRNSELKGFYQCQYEGAGPAFAAGTAGDSADTPLGVSSVNPPGSCLAHPSGPLPVDGTQGSTLSDLTTNPGVPGSSGNAGSDSGTPSSNTENANSDPNSCPAPPTTQSPSPSEQAKDLVSSPSPTSTVGMGAPAPSSTSPSFLLTNGQAAQKLNAESATLTPDTPCSAGDQQCIDFSFALCVNGKFVLQPCSSPLKCYGLPLELKPGTSFACTTTSDAEQRIARTGATGGITGSG